MAPKWIELVTGSLEQKKDWKRYRARIEALPEPRRAVADGTPVRAIAGDDPVEFAETFAQSYSGKRWIDKERARLTKAIEDAERAERR
ncbi:DUF1048 domain-containing protein [Amycolatopsis thermoflava]|uniref:DNA-binding ferritin-like protein (Dps family) n=1 Tax=Amycolatopsis thermoflava TaxID=84480 RepID=A0A3N2H745_9PSEU|nr:DUF1048 domain-containing protein [Amycolatopsis thermoflava]ROS44723.1 DNA-binding ferritin-like protein (Dps family) [Amycolatopsis thermoflava]